MIKLTCLHDSTKTVVVNPYFVQYAVDLSPSGTNVLLCDGSAVRVVESAEEVADLIVAYCTNFRRSSHV